jgi:hypothetical protein
MRKYILLGLSCLIMAFSVGCGTSDSVSTKNATEATTTSKAYETTIDGKKYTIMLKDEDDGLLMEFIGYAETNEKAYALVMTSLSTAETAYKADTIQQYRAYIYSDECSGYYMFDKTKQGTTEFGTNSDGSTTTKFPDWLSKQDATTMQTYSLQ